ncbi:MAG: hypothetical protein JW976_11470 [Syntrophaceae bacterium]|nr:hypothetical protein [Syntrophaceae bacterium]
MLHNFKKYLAIVLSITMLSGIILFCFTQQVQADKPRRVSAHAVKKTKISRQKVFVDSRYRHNRFYPIRGRYFRSLPREHRLIKHGHSHYYYSHGVWYRPHGGQYVVVAPPVGLFVPFLPLAYATLWLHGVPYYYANETYYTRIPGGYVIVEPPRGEVSELPPGNEEEDEDIVEDKIFIYPRLGQSEQQQDNDRYECHKLAIEQTNYDPTKNFPKIPPEQIMQKRANYQSAMRSCLDKRGYTAK